MGMIEENHRATIAPRPRAPLWRRLLLCRFDLCDLWYRRDSTAGGGYACAGCDRTSMACPATPSIPGSIFPHFDVDAPMPAPTNAPRGGPIETPFPGRVTIVPKDHVLIPEPPPVPAPIVGYVSQNGLRIFEATDSWSTTLYRDPRDLAPRGGIVEVEIRFRRVVEA